MEKEKLRIDKFLWAIRLYKTRNLAAEACDKGKIKCKGESVKASRNINAGDEYEIKTSEKKWLIKVVDKLYTRVKYAEAINYYIDITPAEEIERIKFESAVFHTGKRMSKIGRPTKKNKRDLNDFLGEGNAP
jgi:ribosome-associated heat shock protein Hsp15